MTMFQKQTLTQILLFLSMALCVPVYALGSTETNSIEAIFDDCIMSDASGISSIFVEKNGKSHHFSSYSDSEALKDFCDEDIANSSKKGKLFKLILTPKKSNRCAQIDDIGECVQWVEEVTLAVKSAQQIPNENKAPPAAPPSDTVDTDAIGCGCRTTHAPLNRAWAFFLLPMLVWARRRLRV